MAVSLVVATGCGREEIEPPVYFSLPSAADRAASSFEVKVATGFCVGDDVETRLATPRIRTESTAYIVSFVQITEVGDDICHGVGTGNFLRILVPPRRREAIRALGLRDGFAYISAACDAVSRQLDDRPKDEWCLY